MIPQNKYRLDEYQISELIEIFFGFSRAAFSG
jgi:hypothetical protein